MKIGVLVLGVSGLVCRVGVASAERAPARVGFQMDVRTGYSIPLGNLYEGVKMSDLASGQVPFIVDIGAKVIPNLFIGGYFGLGFGGVSGITRQACDSTGQSCVGVGVHLGVEVQYHIRPRARSNPWLGYGFGFESLAIGEGNGDTVSYGGFEFARFMFGVDFRINRVFGVGPFADLALCQYSTQSVNSSSQDIPNTATHEWLTLGARFVFFP